MKRKYERGRLVPELWIVGGTVSKQSVQEGLAPDDVFFVPVVRRNKPTIAEVIRRNVHPASELHTDEWKGYNGVVDAGLVVEHKTVNHSRWFVDLVCIPRRLRRIGGHSGQAYQMV